MKKKYKTIVLSDIHLGSQYSKAKEVVKFLKSTECDVLILNGDIIDGWAIKRGGKLTVDHIDCIRLFLKKSKKVKTYWIKGNHDEFLLDFIPFKIGNIELLQELTIYGKNGEKYLVTHGDMFDVFVNKMKWLAKIGSIGYDMALWLNKWYNKYRNWRGLEYFSLSKKIKDSVKIATNFIGDFEHYLTNHAKEMGFDGVICGHIHKAETKKINDISYMNSGDWVESLTALVETHDGKWKVIQYKEPKLKK
jgi:UDP-2,3-diacylglucosamine pyrophosphatase LpxH